MAGRPADEAGARAAFGRLDRHRKDAIATRDLEMLTGNVRGERGRGGGGGLFPRAKKKMV